MYTSSSAGAAQGEDRLTARVADLRWGAEEATVLARARTLLLVTPAFTTGLTEPSLL